MTESNQSETANSPKKTSVKVVTAATLLTPTIALLKKDGANFKSWYRTVTIKLSNYKLLNLFDKDNKLSKEQNGQLIEFLFAVVEPVVLDMLNFDESIDQVHVLWNELTKFGERKRAIKLESLEEDLDSLSISDPRKAKDLLDKLESTFQALEDMGQPLSEKKKINYLTRAISPCHRLKTIHDLCSVAGSDSTFNSFANLLKRSIAENIKDHSNTACNNCGKLGHLARNCRYNINTNNNHKKTNYTKPNHANIAETNVSEYSDKNTNVICRRAEEFDSNKDISIKSIRFSTSALLSSKCADSNTWIFDSGASVSMTWDKSIFTESTLKPCNDSIRIGDGKFLYAEYMGTVNIPLDTDRQNFLTIKDVRLVPKLKYQLISFSSLDDMNLKTVTKDGVLHVFDANDNEITKGFKCDDKLWKLVPMKTNSSSQAKSVSLLSRSMSLHELHNNCAHRSHHTLLDLHRKGLLKGINLTDKNWNGCPSCELGKGHASHSTKNSTIEHEPGTLVTDIVEIAKCGRNGPRYLSVILETSTRYTLIEPICKKTTANVTEHIRTAINFFNTQLQRLNIKVHKLISDNGKEYTSKRLRKLMRKNGILHQTTAPYHPSQNGIAERKNRSLIETIATVMIDSKLPDRFWPDVAISVNHVLNRLPHSTLTNNISPYEALFQRQPTINYFRPIGSECFVLIRPNSNSKIQARTDPAIFLGYEPDSRAYKVYNLSTQKIMASGDVTFRSHGIAVKKSTDITRKSPRLQLHLSKLNDPDSPSYQQAMNGPYNKEFHQAIKEELNNLKSNGVLELVPYDGQQTIPGHFIFKLKRDQNGDPERFKARFVAGGDKQTVNDYGLTYAPVAKPLSLFTLLTYAARTNSLAHHVDFDAAFLNAPLKENIYMKQIPGFEETSKDYVYKLKKTLYGLKQAPREWYLLLKNALLQLNWTMTQTDDCVFKRTDAHGRALLLVYVDDVVIIAPNETSMLLIKRELLNLFPAKDLGPLSHLLGMRVRIDYQNKFIELDQSALIEKYEKIFALPNRVPVHCPTFTETHVFNKNYITYSTNEYLSRISALFHIARFTRPDILTNVSLLSRHSHNVTAQTSEAVDRVLNYVFTTKPLTFKLQGTGSNEIFAYTDANWGGNKDEIKHEKTDMKSTSGSAIFWGDALIHWCTEKQNNITLSTMEAEYVAATETGKDIIFIKNIIKEITGEEAKATILCDNQAAIGLALKCENRRKTRHMELRYFIMRDWIDAGIFNIQYISSENNVADAFTKLLHSSKHQVSRKRLKVSEQGELLATGSDTL